MSPHAHEMTKLGGPPPSLPASLGERLSSPPLRWRQLPLSLPLPLSLSIPPSLFEEPLGWFPWAPVFPVWWSSLLTGIIWVPVVIITTMTDDGCSPFPLLYKRQPSSLLLSSHRLSLCWVNAGASSPSSDHTPLKRTLLAKHLRRPESKLLRVRKGKAGGRWKSEWIVTSRRSSLERTATSLKTSLTSLITSP